MDESNYLRFEEKELLPDDSLSFLANDGKREETNNAKTCQFQEHGLFTDICHRRDYM